MFSDGPLLSITAYSSKKPMIWLDFSGTLSRTIQLEETLKKKQANMYSAGVSESIFICYAANGQVSVIPRGLQSGGNPKTLD